MMAFIHQLWVRWRKVNNRPYIRECEHGKLEWQNCNRCPENKEKRKKAIN